MKKKGPIHDLEGWSGRVWGIDTPDKIREMLHQQIRSHEKGECHPFVYFVEGSVSGITRYLHLSSDRKALEVGGTCVAPRWRRTFVNTTVKKLLFTYAFEKLGAVRIELRVDGSNYISQMNVLRLGATYEGVIRHWQVRKNGDLPDGRLYSITNRDWPAVERRLLELQDRQQPKTVFLSLEMESRDLRLKIYQLKDSEDLLALSR